MTLACSFSASISVARWHAMKWNSLRPFGPTSGKVGRSFYDFCSQISFGLNSFGAISCFGFARRHLIGSAGVSTRAENLFVPYFLCQKSFFRISSETISSSREWKSEILTCKWKFNNFYCLSYRVLKAYTMNRRETARWRRGSDSVSAIIIVSPTTATFCASKWTIMENFPSFCELSFCCSL